MCATLLLGMAQAQRPHGGHHGHRDGVSGPTQPTEQPAPRQHHSRSTEFKPVTSCYIAETGSFVVIDSVDCAIDLVMRQGNEMVRVGRYVTDNLHKRHDVKNIIRPRSIAVVGNKIVFVASAAKSVDTSYLGVLDMAPDADGKLPRVAYQGFHSNNYAFSIEPRTHELIVVGNSPAGYDFNIINIEGGLEQIGNTPVQTLHYRVPKQAERIKASDPIGIGLTVVAVAVVFLALMSIYLILAGYGKVIMGFQNRKKEKTPTTPAEATTTNTGNKEAEIYAAIAAAIHLYNDELHDEEDNIITIQKVERAWTPWNAKYYNMNHYFNRR